MKRLLFCLVGLFTLATFAVAGDVEVVDLHADELLDTTQGMQSIDILNYQMEKFREKEAR